MPFFRNAEKKSEQSKRSVTKNIVPQYDRIPRGNLKGTGKYFSLMIMKILYNKTRGMQLKSFLGKNVSSLKE